MAPLRFDDISALHRIRRHHVDATDSDGLMRLSSSLRLLLTCACTLAAVPLSVPAFGEVVRQPVLASRAALKAAEVAVSTCRDRGYAVTATVVNGEGSLVAVLRADGATPHTVENSYNKAYTAITLGPVQKADSTSKIYEVMKMNPGVGSWPLPPDPIRGLSFNSGGLVLFSAGSLVGGIGVSGAPKGVMDEVCALAGRDAASLLLR